MMNERTHSKTPVKNPSILIIEENETDVFLIHRMFELLKFKGTLVWKPNVEKGIEYLNQKFYQDEQLEDLIILSLDLPAEELVRFMERYTNLYTGLHNPPLLFGLGTFIENPELSGVYRYRTFSRVRDKPLSAFDIEDIGTMTAERELESDQNILKKRA